MEKFKIFSLIRYVCKCNNVQDGTAIAIPKNRSIVYAVEKWKQEKNHSLLGLLAEILLENLRLHCCLRPVNLE